jgi:hypothetical protein
MPTRWLSIRKREPQPYEYGLQPGSKSQDFDFAFGDHPSPAQSVSQHLGPRLVNIRPTTSAGVKGRRRARTAGSSKRPRTSSSYRPSHLQNPNAISKAENPYIGLAFGSPGHPPSQYRASPIGHSPLQRSPLPRHYRDKAEAMENKTWKKFGALFKTKQLLVKRTEVPSGPTIGLPTGLVILDKDSSVPFDQLAQQQQRSTPSPPTRNAPSPLNHKQNHAASATLTRSYNDDVVSRPSTTATEADSTSEPYVRPPLPKLELEIPRNLDAAKRSSSLLARRSRVLENLKTFDDSRPSSKGTSHADEEERLRIDTEALPKLPPPRRLTTPTMTKSPAASKYSLFPSQSPAPVKIVGRVPSEEHGSIPQLKRSATSPARLSPMQDTFPLVHRPPPTLPKENFLNEPFLGSPEDNTASTDRSTPWSSAHSFESSVSSATTVDEIFFDIKSFRDSKGVEDGQFVMTRPDSAQVEIARTRSKKAIAPLSRLRQMEAVTTDETSNTSTPGPSSLAVSPELSSSSNWTTKHASVNTNYFDEAIAEVERLTTPTNALSTLDKLPAIPTVTLAAPEDSYQKAIASVAAQMSKPSEHHLRLHSKTHQEVSHLIPSPVAEVREEDSPRPKSPPSQAPTPQPGLGISKAKIISPRVAAMKMIDRPIDDSPTLPQGPPPPSRKTTPAPEDDKPPPVPKKDAKFIPMSKYAPKGTAKAIEQRAGVIPQRPTRANTDELPLRSSSRVRTERSATLPSSTQSPQLQPSRAAPTPPRPNPVGLNPVNAEVAVARTVSLSRKVSARVHVPGPKLAARRAEAKAQAPSAPQHQRKSSFKHKRTTSVASQKSNRSISKSTSILGHRHKKTTSSAKATTMTPSTKAQVTKLMMTDSKSGNYAKVMSSKDNEHQLIKDARKWEILEKKAYSPTVVQAERGHRPGISVGLVVESI